MRIVFMGTPDFSIPVLHGLMEKEGTQIVGVYTPPDRPRGRGRDQVPTPVKAAALELDLPVFQPASLRPERVRRELGDLRPDVAVVAAYGKLLPPEILSIPSHGCLNIHPSLLPRYRGPSPVATAILDGVERTGVTLMLLDEGMDTGPIVAQEDLELTGSETAHSLTEELFRLGANLLLESLDAWVAGTLDAKPQDNGQATVTTKLERSDGSADWSLAAQQLERMQRAYTPWPGLFTQWQGKSLKLVEVMAPVAMEGYRTLPAAGPGEVVALSHSESPLGIGTAEGILGIKALQLEGRRPLPAAEFLRGYPDFVGSIL